MRGGRVGALLLFALLAGIAIPISAVSVTGSYSGHAGALTFSESGAQYVGSNMSANLSPDEFQYDFIASADHVLTVSASTSGNPLHDQTNATYALTLSPDYANTTQTNSTSPAMSLSSSVDLSQPNTTTSFSVAIDYSAYNHNESNASGSDLNFYIRPVITMNLATPGAAGPITLQTNASPYTVYFTGRVTPVLGDIYLWAVDNGNATGLGPPNMDLRTGEFNLTYTIDPQSLSPGEHNIKIFANYSGGYGDYSVTPPLTPDMLATQDSPITLLVTIVNATPANKTKNATNSTNQTQHADLIMQTDKSTYEQGQAIVLNGTVEIDGVPHAPVGGVISVKALIPNYAPWPFRVTTDGSGSFTTLPFAGFNTGEYVLIAQASVKLSNNSTTTVSADVSFNVTPPATPVTDMGPQLQQLTAMYEAQIPWGPIWGHPFDHIRKVTPEGAYGDYENMFIACGFNPLYFPSRGIGACWADPNRDFVCGGYQGQVLTFFNNIRFNPNPNIRALLDGLDYGPIQRGHTIYVLYAGSHHATVLFPIGENIGSSQFWQDARVFDPWPHQKPLVFTVAEFRGAWLTTTEPDSSYVASSADPSVGYPFTGAPIETNPFAGLSPRTSNDIINISQKYGVQPPDISISVGSPVAALITNSKGQMVGMLPNGTLVQQFPVIEADQFLNSTNFTSGWYFGLPNTDTYKITLTGLLKNSSFDLAIRNLNAQNSTVLDYGEQSIGQGQSASVNITKNVDTNSSGGATQPPLMMPSGSAVKPSAQHLPPEPANWTAPTRLAPGAGWTTTTTIPQNVSWTTTIPPGQHPDILQWIMNLIASILTAIFGHHQP